MLVGQRSGDDGMTRRRQQEVVEHFNQGHINLLIATSVGEEGLDIQAWRGSGQIFSEDGKNEVGHQTSETRRTTRPIFAVGFIGQDAVRQTLWLLF